MPAGTAAPWTGGSSASSCTSCCTGSLRSGGAFREQTFDNVLHKPLVFPEEPAVSKACQSIIRKLLVRDPTKRLGTQGGAEEVKAQAFFAGLDFCLIRSTAAPLLPPVTSPPDRSVPQDEETIYVLN